MVEIRNNFCYFFVGVCAVKHNSRFGGGHQLSMQLTPGNHLKFLYEICPKCDKESPKIKPDQK